jgi:hypothetical protein
MEPCPKCGFALSDDAIDCPACGIVLAKFRPRRSASPPSPRPAVEPSPRPSAQPPPAPAVQDSPWPAVQPPPAPPITANTLAALHRVRPWIAFVVGSSFAISVLMVLGGAAFLVGGLASSELLPLGLFYLLYGAVGLALVFPLRRSIAALRQVKTLGPSAALEQFAIHHAVFWRRTGVVTAVVVGLVVLALLLGVVLGLLAAITQ